jgi:Domain of unknown function (DUF4260)
MTTVSTSTQSQTRFTFPGVLLRLEGAAVLIGASTLYAYSGTSWWLFALLFLLPDVAIAVYAINQRAGAIAYNLAHTTIGPILLVLIGFTLGSVWALPVALIWGAHIGMDRMVGFGLKYPGSFKDTHLARV